MGVARNSNPFKLLSVYVLVTFKNEEDTFKNEGARVVTTFLPLKNSR